MKQEKLIIYYHLFVPWIHDGYDRADLLDAWSSGESPEDHALSIAGSFPVQHFKNWDEVKHHWITVGIITHTMAVKILKT